MKIETQASISLIELVTHINKNNIVDRVYLGHDGEKIIVDENGNIKAPTIFNDETEFLITREEELTLNTKIRKLLVKFKSSCNYIVYGNTSISEFHESIQIGRVEAFYIINGLEITLIWSEGQELL